MKRLGLFFFLPIVSTFILIILLMSPFSLLAASTSGKEATAESSQVQSSIPIKISGYGQFLFVGSQEQPDTFSIRRARLSLGGRPLQNLTLKLQVDLSKSPILMDALVELSLRDEFNLRIGQFKVPFSLESTTSASELLTINRSQPVELLAPGRDNGAAGRDIGALVFGHLGLFDYALGLVNGAGINKKDDNNHKDWVGQLTVSPIKKVVLGFSIYNGRQTAAGNPINLVRNKYGLELNLNFKPLTLWSELIRARDDRTEKQGWYVQAALDLIPGKYQLVFKLDSLNLDRNQSGQKSQIYTVGANWYLSAKSKVQANFEYHQSDYGPDYRTVLLHLQVGF
ncbi:MAG: porin [Candidatus Saccharicenans sp.]